MVEQQQGMKRHKPAGPTFPNRLMMAAIAVVILLVSLYFLQDHVFPSDITYKNVSSSSAPYRHIREAP